jgi:hypothetical protein
MRRRSKRVGLVLAGSAVVAGLGIGSASAGQASAAQGSARALASGAGWAASWDYYQTDAFRYRLTMPGVEVSGFASDRSGRRLVVGTVTDTTADGRCADGVVNVGDEVLVNEQVCDGQPPKHFSTRSFFGMVGISAGRTSGGFSDGIVSVPIPSSSDDPALRTVGNGVSWDYYTPTAFRYTLKHRYFRVVGFGSHQPDGQRWIGSSVEHTGPPNTCVLGVTVALNSGQEAHGRVCTPGAFTSYSGVFRGVVTLEGHHETLGLPALTVEISVPHG